MPVHVRLVRIWVQLSLASAASMRVLADVPTRITIAAGVAAKSVQTLCPVASTAARVCVTKVFVEPASKKSTPPAIVENLLRSCSVAIAASKLPANG